MFRKIERSVSLFVENVGAVLFVVMVLVVCFTVVTRYFFSYTPSWSEETALLCMVWFGFLSMALGVRDDLYLSITVIDRLLPKPLLKLLQFFKYICTGGYGVFMVVQGWRMVQVGLLNRFPGLGITSAWLYAPLCLGGTAIAVYSVEKFFLTLFDKNVLGGEEAAPECGGGLQ